VADRPAKEGSELPAYTQNYACITNVKRCSKMRKKLERESFWYPDFPGYRRRHLDAPANPPELTILHRLLAERSGHGDFLATSRGGSATFTVANQLLDLRTTKDSGTIPPPSASAGKQEHSGTSLNVGWLDHSY
jgi:hypothetical protein